MGAPQSQQKILYPWIVVRKKKKLLTQTQSNTEKGRGRGGEEVKKRGDDDTDVAAVMGACADGAMDTGTSISIDDIVAVVISLYRV